jgi:acyl-CoA thioesterase FadM
MNLWLRILHLIIASFFRPKLDPVRDVSRLTFRVWPQDLDTSLHMNNGRYWTLMDLGRTDIMIRSGLWRPILKHRWVPVVAAGQIRFRRELKPFRAFTLETRILTWSDSHALVRAGLYDRKERRFVPMDRLLNEIGLQAEPSEAAPEVEAFLRAEETLKSAA